MIGTLDSFSPVGSGGLSGLADRASRFGSTNTRRSCTPLAQFNEPFPRQAVHHVVVRPFLRINNQQARELHDYIVRFRNGTGTDDIRDIEKVLKSQGGSFHRRGSFSQDLDAKLALESVRFLSDLPCIERIVKTRI